MNYSDIDLSQLPQHTWSKVRAVLSSLPRGVVAALAALAMLVVIAYLAFAWVAANVGSRRAVVESPQATAAAAPERAVSPPPSTAADAEPPAPAVAGGSVNKCVLDGQLTYTNAPCPEGSRLVNDDAPLTAVLPPAFSDSANRISQQSADCNFLGAEITRLDYEFSQPLPPEILDHLSTRLADLRAQAETARCVPPSKPAADAALAPERSRVPAKEMNQR
jgi:hypothetical protein